MLCIRNKTIFFDVRTKTKIKCLPSTSGWRAWKTSVRVPRGADARAPRVGHRDASATQRRRVQSGGVGADRATGGTPTPSSRAPPRLEADEEIDPSRVEIVPYGGKAARFASCIPCNNFYATVVHARNTFPRGRGPHKQKRGDARACWYSRTMSARTDPTSASAWTGRTSGCSTPRIGGDADDESHGDRGDVPQRKRCTSTPCARTRSRGSCCTRAWARRSAAFRRARAARGCRRRACGRRRGWVRPAWRARARGRAGRSRGGPRRDSARGCVRRRARTPCTFPCCSTRSTRRRRCVGGRDPSPLSRVPWDTRSPARPSRTNHSTAGAMSPTMRVSNPSTKTTTWSSVCARKGLDKSKLVHEGHAPSARDDRVVPGHEVVVHAVRVRRVREKRKVCTIFLQTVTI